MLPGACLAGVISKFETPTVPSNRRGWRPCVGFVVCCLHGGRRQGLTTEGLGFVAVESTEARRATRSEHGPSPAPVRSTSARIVNRYFHLARLFRGTVPLLLPRSLFPPAPFSSLCIRVPATQNAPRVLALLTLGLCGLETQEDKTFHRLT